MQYEPVYLYDSNGVFVGAAIKKANAPQLQSVNIWSDSDEETADFRKTLDGLNSEQELRKFWPRADDPEVGKLVEDPEWEPLELHKGRVPDWDASTVVMVKQSVWGYDYNSEADAVLPLPNPTTGQVEWRETQEMDTDASNIVYKDAMVPDPTEAQTRYFKAQETVARQRMAAVDSLGAS